MPNFLTRPLTTKPKTMAEQFAEEFDPSNTNVVDRGYVKPFVAGAAQGLGDVISDFTSPLGIASLAAGPVGRLRGIGSVVGKLIQSGSRFEKAAPIVDEAGRTLGGFAGPVVKGAKATESTRKAIEDAEILDKMKSALVPRTKTTPR